MSSHLFISDPLSRIFRTPAPLDVDLLSLSASVGHPRPHAPAHPIQVAVAAPVGYPCGCVLYIHNPTSDLLSVTPSLDIEGGAVLAHADTLAAATGDAVRDRVARLAALSPHTDASPLPPLWRVDEVVRALGARRAAAAHACMHRELTELYSDTDSTNQVPVRSSSRSQDASSDLETECDSVDEDSDVPEPEDRYSHSGHGHDVLPPAPAPSVETRTSTLRLPLHAPARLAPVGALPFARAASGDAAAVAASAPSAPVRLAPSSMTSAAVAAALTRMRPGTAGWSFTSPTERHVAAATAATLPFVLRALVATGRLQVAGAGAPVFVPPHSSLPIIVVVTPRKTGEWHGNLTLHDGAASVGVGLFGRAVAAPLGVSTTRLNLGDVQVGQERQIRFFLNAAAVTDVPVLSGFVIEVPEDSTSAVSPNQPAFFSLKRSHGANLIRPGEARGAVLYYVPGAAGVLDKTITIYNIFSPGFDPVSGQPLPAAPKLSVRLRGRVHRHKHVFVAPYHGTQGAPPLDFGPIRLLDEITPTCALLRVSQSSTPAPVTTPSPAAPAAPAAPAGVSFAIDALRTVVGLLQSEVSSQATGSGAISPDSVGPVRLTLTAEAGAAVTLTAAGPVLGPAVLLVREAETPLKPEDGLAVQIAAAQEFEAALKKLRVVIRKKRPAKVVKALANVEHAYNAAVQVTPGLVPFSTLLPATQAAVRQLRAGIDCAGWGRLEVVVPPKCTVSVLLFAVPPANATAGEFTGTLSVHSAPLPGNQHSTHVPQASIRTDFVLAYGGTLYHDNSSYWAAWRASLAIAAARPPPPPTEDLSRVPEASTGRDETKLEGLRSALGAYAHFLDEELGVASSSAEASPPSGLEAAVRAAAVAAGRAPCDVTDVRLGDDQSVTAALAAARAAAGTTCVVMPLRPWAPWFAALEPRDVVFVQCSDNDISEGAALYVFGAGAGAFTSSLRRMLTPATPSNQD